MKQFLSRLKAQTVCEISGVGSLILAGFMIAVSVGFIVLGICLLLLSVAIGRGTRN